MDAGETIEGPMAMDDDLMYADYGELPPVDFLNLLLNEEDPHERQRPSQQDRLEHMPVSARGAVSLLADTARAAGTRGYSPALASSFSVQPAAATAGADGNSALNEAFPFFGNHSFMHMSDDIDVLQASTHDQRMEGAVFEPGAPPPQQVAPNWMEQCSSFMGQLEQHLALPCCYRELTEAELDQVLANPAMHSACPGCHQKVVAGRPIAVYFQTLKGLLLIRRALFQPQPVLTVPWIDHTTSTSPGIVAAAPQHGMHGMHVPHVPPPLEAMTPPHPSPRTSPALPQTPDPRPAAPNHPHTGMVPTPYAMHASSGAMHAQLPGFRPPQPGDGNACGTIDVVVPRNAIAGPSQQPAPVQHSPGRAPQQQEGRALEEVVHFPMKGSPAVPIDSLLPLLSGGKWRSPDSCMPGLEERQVHFASQHKAGVVNLLPNGKLPVHVGGGRHVSVHLELARLCARCALPFEKSNSSAAPGQHSTRSFKKATVNATVNVCVGAWADEGEGLPPPVDKHRITLQVYTLHERDWQQTLQNVKQMPDVILENLRSCQSTLQDRLRVAPNSYSSDARQDVLSSMCDHNEVPWIGGSEKGHYKHTFKGRILKQVEIDMAPGTTMQADFNLDLQPNNLAPVRLFVAALVPSGPEAVPDSVVAVECTVPMLCVGKRFKTEKRKTKDRQDEGGSYHTEATEEVKTDYLELATKKLGYEWCDSLQCLFDNDSGPVVPA